MKSIEQLLNHADVSFEALSDGIEVTNPATGGTVAFVARSKLGGRAHRLCENSRFVREAGRWYYVDGVVGGG